MRATEPEPGEGTHRSTDPGRSGEGRIAFVSAVPGEGEQLFTTAPGGGEAVSLTVGQGFSAAWSPGWSPDGRRVCFAAHLDTYSHLYLINDDGSGLLQLTDGEADDDFPAWSPDGTRIAFARGNRHAGDALFLLSPGSGELQRLTSQGWMDATPAWSPDGQWLVFARVFSQPSGLHVMPVTGGEARFLGPGHSPDWSPSGQQLVFVHADSLWVMALSAEGEAADAARPLTRAISFVDSSPSWAPDGRHLVFSRERGESGVTAHRLTVMDTSTGATWEIGEGRDPDWGPPLSSSAQHHQ